MEPDHVSHFEILRLIGRGGMGEVHEATDLKLRRRVALKFLSPELARDRAALTRFEREAFAAAELNHPHIATVHAFERDTERPFIAMELLAGPSLRERIEAGPLPVDDALAIARDVAGALAYAHRRGTSHRDIKPENLMFDEHGTIKIMDFGLARATMASRLTMTGASLGTPAYMAPEAIRGETGPEGDVFALGLVLYEMLAGRRAYPGDNSMAVMFAIANEAPAPLAGLRPDVPEAVVALVGALLVKDPAARVTAADAARELSALTGVALPGGGTFAAESGATGGLATRSSAATAAPNTATTSAARTQAIDARRDRTRPNTIAVIAWAAVVIAGGFWIFSRDQGARHAKAERIQREAVQLDQSGDADRARTLFLQALKLDPKQAGALTGLGQIYERDGFYTSAESLYRAVIQHNADDTKLRASGYYNLGSTQLATRAYPSAVQSLQTSIALDSSHANVYNNLGVALIENGQAGDALSVLERGIRAFRGEKYLYKNAARAALQLGDASRALTLLDQALALDPEFTEARALRDQAASLPPTPGAGTP